VQAGAAICDRRLGDVDEGMAIAMSANLMRLRLAAHFDRVRVLIQSGGLEKARVIAEAEGIVSLEAACTATD